MNDKFLHIGGLAENVTEEILRTIISSFGEILTITMPINNETGKHRGFAFVHLETVSEAKDVIDNLDENELFGRTLRVNVANPRDMNMDKSKPIWADDEWLKQYSGASTIGQSTEIENKGK
ncbi:hypothetical protein SNEBB_000858 [Seison nebaliae]|nr:hypothetical protein SNEBB_000858 [Seison nebaliae]